MTKKQEENSKLNNALAEIEKKFGKGTVTTLNSNYSVEINSISTGSIQLDKATGVAGLPKGRIIEIFGKESSGKSTLSLSVIREAQKENIKCVYMDAEHAFDKAYAQKVGVNLDNLFFVQPDIGEDGLIIVEEFVKSEEIGLIIVDSVTALVPKAILEGEIGQSHMALQARMMSQAMQKLTAIVSKTNTVLLFLNQVRQNISTTPFNHGSNFVTTGGNSLKFAASIRIELIRIGTVKRGEEVIATEVKAKIVKNKLSAPYKEALFEIYFDSGICKISDLINLAIEEGAIKKSGAWFSFEGENIAQGKENLRMLLKENKELYEKIEKQLLNKKEI